MTKRELKLVGQLLNIASNEFSNHGCNELESELFVDWPEEEKQEMAKAIEEYNNSPHDYNKDIDVSRYPDWLVMKYLAKKLQSEETK